MVSVTKDPSPSTASRLGAGRDDLIWAAVQICSRISALPDGIRPAGPDTDTPRTFRIGDRNGGLTVQGCRMHSADSCDRPKQAAPVNIAQLTSKQMKFRAVEFRAVNGQTGSMANIGLFRCGGLTAGFWFSSQLPTDYRRCTPTLAPSTSTASFITRQPTSGVLARVWAPMKSTTVAASSSPLASTRTVGPAPETTAACPALRRARISSALGRMASAR